MNANPEQLTKEQIDAVLSVTMQPDLPNDFQQFWQSTIDELNRIPLDLEVAPITVSEAPAGVETFVWTANSVGGRRISGPLIMPERRADRLPQWVYGHGYGSLVGCGWQFRPAERGFITLGVDARGYGRSRIEGDPGIPGWILRGIESPETYILRGAVADTVRAVQVARNLEGADPELTVLTGGSFSGGLAVLAAPWIENLRYLAVRVPTFGAYPLRRTLVKEGSGKEVNDYLAKLDSAQAERILYGLRYFDAVHAAMFVDVTTTVGVGIVDVVVPGETVAAIYHAIIATDKELLQYPCSHTSHPLASAWERWDPYILDRAIKLVGLSSAASS